MRQPESRWERATLAIARAVIRLGVPADWAEDVERDLEEAWERHRRSRGPVLAAPWILWQAAAFAARFGPDRLRDVVRAVRPSALDLRLALRSTARAPWMGVLAVTSLAVGIGSAVAGYTVVRGAFYSGLPFDEGDRIVFVQDYNRTDRFAVDVGVDEYLRRRSRLSSFQYLEAFVQRAVVMGPSAGQPASVRALFTTADFLRMTGVAPLLGRLPDREDARPGATPVVVLPYRTWRLAFGQDPGVVGSGLLVGGVERTVIGVMPEGFGFPWGDEIWIPFDPREADGPLRMVGKIRRDVDLATVRAELSAVSIPDPTQVGPGKEISHLALSVTRPLVDDRQELVLAIPVLVLVLLLVVMATNVANLVLARNAARAPELAVRGALGAGRLRIVGQLTLETALVATTAAVLGVAFSRWVVAVFETELSDLPFWVDFSLQPRTVLFTIALASLATLVVGVWPAVRSTRSDPGAALRDLDRQGSTVRFGRSAGVLIVAQMAISVGFLSAAAMLGRSLISFGFERYRIPASETLVAQLYFGWPEALRDPDSGLSGEERERTRLDFMAESRRKRRELMDAVLRFPGVETAAYASRFPGNESERMVVEIDGLPEATAPAETAEIGAGYFELLDAEALAGRTFNSDEYQDRRPVVVVTEPFVRERLGGGSPLGRLVRLTPASATDADGYPWAEIVGVVPDLGLNPADPAGAAGVYRPLGDTNVLRLGIRGQASPGSWTPRLLTAAREIDPGIQVQWSRTLAAQMREPVAIFRGLGFGFLLLGSLALALSSASLYALTSCAVTRRTRELGIRKALGADGREIVTTVVKRSSVHLLLGVGFGSALGFGLLELGEAFPWDVRESDPIALGAVVAVLSAATLVALAPPVRRALSIQPSDAMRSG